MTSVILRQLTQATRELVADWPEDVRRAFAAAVKAKRAAGLTAYESLRDGYNRTWGEWQGRRQ